MHKIFSQLFMKKLKSFFLLMSAFFANSFLFLVERQVQFSFAAGIILSKAVKGYLINAHIWCRKLSTLMSLIVTRQMKSNSSCWSIFRLLILTDFLTGCYLGQFFFFHFYSIMFKYRKYIASNLWVNCQLIRLSYKEIICIPRGKSHKLVLYVSVWRVYVLYIANRYTNQKETFICIHIEIIAILTLILQYGSF